ncbi:MAG: acyl-CoA thioesterase [Paludibacteraceae bacterium]|nr:acyl-CoA thioesterase [Paludibacteraceae bacterium]
MKYTAEDIDKVVFNHQESIQIRFNDVDVLGHVNNAIQLNYFDYGKMKYFEALKKQRINWHESELVIVNLNVDFYCPVFMGDDIRVKTKVYEIGKKSVKLLQILFDEKTQTVKSVCHSVMCGFDTKTNTSVLISDEWKNLIQSFEGSVKPS